MVCTPKHHSLRAPWPPLDPGGLRLGTENDLPAFLTCLTCEDHQRVSNLQEQQQRDRTHSFCQPLM